MKIKSKKMRLLKKIRLYDIILYNTIIQHRLEMKMENTRQKKCCHCIEINTGAKMIAVINILRGIITLFLVYVFDQSEYMSYYSVPYGLSYVQFGQKDQNGRMSFVPYIEIYGIYAVTILFVTTDLTLIFGLVKNSLAIMKIWMVTTWIRNLVSIFTSI